MSALEQVLVISLNGSKYAIETDHIQHILRVPEITDVPLTPPVLRGICSLEGGIITVFDGKKLIDSDSDVVDIEEYKSRMLTMRSQNDNFSILVDEVVDNISPEPGSIEESESSEDDPVEMLIKTEDEIIQVLSVEKLTKDIGLTQFIKSDVKDISTLDGNDKSGVPSDSKRFLFFNMGNESFALDIETIREIIFQRDITPIADSAEEVMGMFTLREHVLMSVDLRKVFNMEGTHSEKNRTIIIQSGNSAIGLLVDAIVDIRDVTKADIDKIPEHFDDEKISGVANVDNELISIIDYSVLEDLIENHKSSTSGNVTAKKDEKESGDNLEVVIFTINEKEYAFNIDDVEEIIRFTEITEIPEAPKYLKGIINLRGEIIPILSLHERMGIKENIDEDTKTLVCKVNGKKLGFLVDNVNQVLDVSSENLQENDNHDALFSNVILLNDGERIILEVAVSQILDEEELTVLTESVEGEK